MYIIYSLQLCVNVQIPTSLDGLAGSAVFIDTNHGFSMERLKGMRIRNLIF